MKHCVECNFETDSDGDGNEHEFNFDHHVMDDEGFSLAVAKATSLGIK